LLLSTDCPSPLSPATTPAPFRKTHVRHGGNELTATAAGFRLRLGGGVALRLRSSRLSACTSLPPLADRRPKPFKKTVTRFCID
jgi:hypothetical protein